MADKTAAAAMKPATTRAYVTLLADDDGSAFEDVVRLAKGLRSAGSAYPLVVAVLPNVPASSRRVLMDELGCVVREVQPVHPPDYNKLRVWEFVEYDQMMYLDATGFQGSLENIHEKFEPNGGPPPAPCVDADMFVYKPSMATARLLLNSVDDMMRMNPRTTVADLVLMSPRTTLADQPQAASRQSSNAVTTAKQVMTAFFMVAVAAVTIYLHNY